MPIWKTLDSSQIDDSEVVISVDTVVFKASGGKLHGNGSQMIAVTVIVIKKYPDLYSHVRVESIGTHTTWSQLRSR